MGLGKYQFIICVGLTNYKDYIYVNLVLVELFVEYFWWTLSIGKYTFNMADKCLNKQKIFIYSAQLAGAVKYTDCISTEG